MALVSLISKTRNHCDVIRMGRKSIGPLCCVTHVKEPSALYWKEKGFALQCSWFDMQHIVPQHLVNHYMVRFRIIGLILLSVAPHTYTKPCRTKYWVLWYALCRDKALFKNLVLLSLHVYKDASIIEEKVMLLFFFNPLFLLGRTVLVIAHRLSTIRNADLIAVLNHGSIQEVG